jgi:hypothetical protein
MYCIINIQFVESERGIILIMMKKVNFLSDEENKEIKEIEMF